MLVHFLRCYPIFKTLDWLIDLLIELSASPTREAAQPIQSHWINTFTAAII